MSTATARPSDPGRTLWLQQRRKGIGASDSAAILGVHPYKTAFDVWLEKTGPFKELPPTMAMEWGLRLEDAIAQKYTDDTGRKLWKPDRIYEHQDFPFIICTPDRLVLEEERGLELKTADSHIEWKWGAEHTDEIPREYLVQCQHSMAVLGYSTWDVAVLIGGNDYRLHTVHADRDFQQLLIGRLKEWWQLYVIENRDHPMGNGESASAWLKEKYPTDNGFRIKADEEHQQIGEALATVKGQIKKLEAEEAAYVNQLKAFCGEAAGIDGQGFRCTWTGGRAKETVDWEKLGESLMLRITALGYGDELNGELAKARVSKVSPRAFRFTEGK